MNSLLRYRNIIGHTLRSLMRRDKVAIRGKGRGKREESRRKTKADCPLVFQAITSCAARSFSLEFHGRYIAGIRSTIIRSFASPFLVVDRFVLGLLEFPKDAAARIFLGGGFSMGEPSGRLCSAGVHLSTGRIEK